MGIFEDRARRLSTGESVIVRAACSNDASAVLAHGRAVIDEDEFSVTSSEEYTFTEDQERDWIGQYASDPAKLFIVAENDRQVIGVLFLESDSRKKIHHVASLHMSVNSAWRHRGVGTALLQSAIDWAHTHPVIEKLGLAVFSSNTRAIGLYRKLGFVEEGRRLREIRFASGDYVDDVLMYRFVK
jgi:RimJ/RimL family protein N-acetyltransferase